MASSSCLAPQTGPLRMQAYDGTVAVALSVQAAAPFQKLVLVTLVDLG